MICSAIEGLNIIIPLFNNYAKRLKKGIINAQNPKSSNHWSRSNGFLFRRQIFRYRWFSTVLIAKGQRLDKLKTRGLVINGKSYPIPAIHPDEADSPVDLIIVALKHHHLEEAVQGLEKLVSDSTTIISVMNGLESEEYIGSIYGMDKVLYTISVAIDAVRHGNQTTYTKPGKHYFGEADNTRLSQRVLWVQEAFDRAKMFMKHQKI